MPVPSKGMGRFRRPGLKARATLKTKSRLKPAQFAAMGLSRLQPAFLFLVARALMPGLGYADALYA